MCHAWLSTCVQCVQGWGLCSCHHDPGTYHKYELPMKASKSSSGSTPRQSISSSERKMRCLLNPLSLQEDWGTVLLGYKLKVTWAPVRLFPGYESDQNTRMTVLSTLCSWDISPMICGYSLDAATRLPASRLAKSIAAGSFITGKIHPSQPRSLEMFPCLSLGQIFLPYL